MKKDYKNKALKGWQESLLGFIVSLVILIFLAISYNEVVFVKGETTNSKVIRHFFRYLDANFGKNYVFGFVLFIMIIFGIAALRGYLKENKKSK